MDLIAPKEMFWEYHRLIGQPYPGIVYGQNCPPPPANYLEIPTDQTVLNGFTTIENIGHG